MTNFHLQYVLHAFGRCWNSKVTKCPPCKDGSYEFVEENKACKYYIGMLESERGCDFEFSYVFLVFYVHWYDLSG
jgi:hypothetical protein